MRLSSFSRDDNFIDKYVFYLQEITDDWFKQTNTLPELTEHQKAYRFI